MLLTLKEYPMSLHNGPMHRVVLQGTTDDCSFRADVYVAHVVGFVKEIWRGRGRGRSFARKYDE